MNLILSVILTSGVNLFFLKDSPDLLARIVPPVPSASVILNYSFAGDNWRACTLQSTTGVFDAVIAPPESIGIIGMYYSFDAGNDDNKGMLFIYEVKKSPRMMMPFTVDDLSRVTAQARKKITGRQHVDEAEALLDYAEKMLKMLPYRKGSDLELKKQLLESEVNELRGQIQ